MGQSLAAYIDSLDERADLLWPQPPAVAPLKTTPFVKPLEGIKVVTWDLYGTLLTIQKGHLLHDHEQQLYMQIALEKTIEEFNMWYSMSRKPGQPWEYMLRQYRGIVEDLGMHSVKIGEIPELDSTKVWAKILDRLSRNEYEYDESEFGDLDDLALKVAYFFHANLQGVAAVEHALDTLRQLNAAGMQQGLFADAQAFSIVQFQRALRGQGTLTTVHEFFSNEFTLLSHQVGVKKPSKSMYTELVKKLKGANLKPEQVLHISSRLKDDLAMAKTLGFRTALFAADKNVCSFTGADVRNPEYSPDRLISDVRQVCDILQV